MRSIEADLNRLCAGLKLLNGVVKVSMDADWNNASSYLIEIFLDHASDSNCQLKLELKFSRVAPVAYDRWMIEEVVSGFGGKGADVVVGRVFLGKIPKSAQALQIAVVDKVHLAGYFVVPVSCFDFIPDGGVCESGKEQVDGLAFFFGD